MRVAAALLPIAIAVLKTFPILLYCKVTSRLKVSDYFSSNSRQQAVATLGICIFQELINAILQRTRSRKSQEVSCRGGKKKRRKAKNNFLIGVHARKIYFSNAKLFD